MSDNDPFSTAMKCFHSGRRSALLRWLGVSVSVNALASPLRRAAMASSSR